MDLLTLFKDLVEIDSPSGHEQKVSDYVLNFLLELGFKPLRDKHNMIYLRTGNSDSPKLFSAHMDTVEPGRGVVLLEKDGFLQSAGETILGGDNKVTLAAILYSLQQLKTSNKLPDLELLFTVREETDSGIKDFEASQLKSKLGFTFDVGDGSLDGVYIKTASISDFRIEIVGRSAHICQAENGVNALEVLLDMHNKIKLGQVDPLSTLNFGIINGGIATNSIPGEILILGDLRSFSKERFEELKSNLESVLSESATHFGAKSSITWMPYCEGYTHDTNEADYKQLAEIYKQHELQLKELSDTGGSDAGYLNSIGIKTFCLGDGVYDGHTTNERIEIKTFYKLQEIVEDLMSS